MGTGGNQVSADEKIRGEGKEKENKRQTGKGQIVRTYGSWGDVLQRG